MDLSRLRAFLAMPIATLLAVLVLCVLVVRRPQPEVGLRVPLVKLKHHAFGYACEDDIPHVVRLTADGRMWFVKTEVAADKLGPLIAEVNQGRQEHVVYVMADPAVTFGQFASFLGEINSSLPGLHVLLLTGQLRNYFDPPAIGHSGERVEDAPCDLEWSENGFIAPSMNATAASLTSPIAPERPGEEGFFPVRRETTHNAIPGDYTAFSAPYPFRR